MARLKRAAGMPSIAITADFGFSARLVHLGDTRDLLTQVVQLERAAPGMAVEADARYQGAADMLRDVEQLMLQEAA